MTFTESRPLEARLAEALHDRTAGGEGDLGALWRTIVRSAEGAPQARSMRWPWSIRGGRPWLLAAAGLLLIGSAGLVATGAVRLDLAPAVVRHNGSIVVAGDGRWAVLDPADGTRLPDDGNGTMPTDNGWPEDISWSQDGRQLAFTIPTGAVVRDMATGQSHSVGACSNARGCGVALSPDGAKVAIASGRRLDIYDADGAGATALVELPSGRSLGSPTWSPDGAWIAYVDDGEMHADVALRAIRPDGSGDHLVAVPSDADSIGFVDPGWTSDSRSVVYLGSDSWTDEAASSPPDGTNAPSWDLRIMTVPVTGHQSVPSVVAVVGRCACLGFGPSFDVAPDGFAYVVSTLAMPIRDGAAPRDGLFVVDAATLSARYLSESFGTTVSWRPAP